MVFFFPIIALINYLFDIRTGAFSQFYRLFNFCVSILIIAQVVLNAINTKKLLINNYFLVLMGFWFIYLYRLVIDLEVFHIATGSSYSKSYFYLFTLGVTFAPMVAMSFLKPIDFDYLIRDLKKVLLFFNLIVTVFVLKQLFWGDEHHQRFSLERNGIEFLNPITIGVYATILILVCLFSAKKQLSDYFGLLMGGISLFAAASKGPLLFATLTILVASIHNLNLFFKNYLDFILKMTLVIAAVFTLFLFSSNMVIMERVVNFNADQSSSERIDILSNALSQFLSDPITGSHFLVFKTKLYSHNILLDALLANGIVGIFILLPALMVFFLILFKNKFKSIFLVIVLYLFFCANTSGSIYSSNEFWIALAIVLTNQDQFINQKILSHKNYTDTIPKYIY
jgi:hypothetical protein